MSDLILMLETQVTLQRLLLVLAIFGGINIAWKVVGMVVSLFPPLLSVQSKLWRLLADSVAVSAFRRKAIATRVEEILNQTVFQLERYLPKGWVARAKIRWVRNSQAAQLHERNIVLRVRPGPNPDQNLMQTLWIYFHTVLFPDSRDVIPDELGSGIALYRRA